MIKIWKKTSQIYEASLKLVSGSKFIYNVKLSLIMQFLV